MRTDAFHFFAVILSRKSKTMFLLASMKSPTNCENPSSSLFKGACSGFQIASSDFKVVPKAACESCSESRL